MAKLRLDDKTVRDAMPPDTGNRIDYDVPEGKKPFVRGFALRSTAAGLKSFLLCYVTREGQERRLKIGDYPAHTVTTAREAAAKLRQRIDAGEDPFGERRAAKEAAVAHKAAEAATLDALMAAYVAHLKDAGKPSWREVEASIRRNLSEPFPKLAAMRADAVTLDDVRPVLARLTKAGNWRAAEKLRAYLRAAFTAAREARRDAGMVAFDNFRLASNPMLELRVTRPQEAAQGAATAARERKWALSEEQLRAYWKRLQGLQTRQGALMRLHLLTGGQRMEQLSRLQLPDFDADLKTLTLRDTKGRRSVAHAHVVPLIPDALAALEAMNPAVRADSPKRPAKRKGEGDAEEGGPFLFTVSGGKAAAVPHTLAAAMRSLSETMNEAGEVDRILTPGAIRRTVETRLAAKGVSDEVLARLLSHGLGGVQARNYNAHRYDDEKRAALEKLRTLLEAPKGTVTPFRRKKAG